MSAAPSERTICQSAPPGRMRPLSRGPRHRAAENVDHPPFAIGRAAELLDRSELGMDGENRLLAQQRSYRWAPNFARGRHLTLPGGRRKYGRATGKHRQWRVFPRSPKPSKPPFATATRVAIEGFTHLIPHAAGHEIIRQGAQASDADPHDAGPDLRPADRHGLRRQARSSPGAAIPASARCTACATRSRTAGRSRSRSKSIRTPPWPTPTRPARPACRARSSAAISAATCRRSIRRSSASPARSPARSSPPFRRTGRTWR